MRAFHADFTNEQVFLQDLPRMDDIQWVPLNARYKNLMYLASASNLALAVIWTALSFIFDFWSIPLLAYGVLGITLVIVLVAFLLVSHSFPVKAYAVRQQDVAYKTGLLFRSVTIVPFNRVQHCEINRGVISRMLGLSQVNVYTAGGSGSDISIPGLLEDEAERICAYILEKTRQQTDEEE